MNISMTLTETHRHTLTQTQSGLLFIHLLSLAPPLIAFLPQTCGSQTQQMLHVKNTHRHAHTHPHRFSKDHGKGKNHLVTQNFLTFVRGIVNIDCCSLFIKSLNVETNRLFKGIVTFAP